MTLTKVKKGVAIHAFFSYILVKLNLVAKTFARPQKHCVFAIFFLRNCCLGGHPQIKLTEFWGFSDPSLPFAF